MADRQDIELEDNQMVIQNNDVVWVNSDDQHIEDTINAFGGWWKENPFDGVGIFQYYKSKGTQQIVAKSVKLQLQADGYNVGNVQVLANADIMEVMANCTR